MFTSPIGALLEELGKTSLLSLVTLQLNKHNTCFVPMPNDLNIQLELDKYEKYLIIGCVLGKVQAGKYRSALLRQALIANGMPHPRHGNFAFSSKTESLVLHDYLDMRDLTGERVAEYLVPFLDKAKVWKEALEGNNIPDLAPITSTSGKLGLFGLPGLRL